MSLLAGWGEMERGLPPVTRLGKPVLAMFPRGAG